MNTSDLVIIQDLSASNQELSRLFEKHREYERELEFMARRKWLSSREQSERQRLKRLKLRGRDRIESIIAPHRHTASP
jgi:uncharacterized protein YdcH (DUF465 family)